VADDRGAVFQRELDAEAEHSVHLEMAADHAEELGGGTARLIDPEDAAGVGAGEIVDQQAMLDANAPFVEGAAELGEARCLGEHDAIHAEPLRRQQQVDMVAGDAQKLSANIRPVVVEIGQSRRMLGGAHRDHLGEELVLALVVGVERRLRDAGFARDRVHARGAVAFLPINTLTLGTLPPAKIKNASGLYNLMRNLGGALGLAAINTVITDRLALHWARLSSHIDLANPIVQNYLDQMSGRLSTLLPGDSIAAATRQLSNLLMREAYVMTFNDCLLLMAGVFAFGLATMPLIRKPRQAVGPGH
jgi:hypothetical protein